MLDNIGHFFCPPENLRVEKTGTTGAQKKDTKRVRALVTKGVAFRYPLLSFGSAGLARRLFAWQTGDFTTEFSLLVFVFLFEKIGVDINFRCFF